MYKKLTAIIFSLAILAGCTPNESTEVTETSVTSSTETSAAKSETSVSETEAAAAEAEEVAEKSASSIADNIKEALKSEWKDDVYFAEIFAEDLNGDGVKELIANYSYRSSSERGATYVFDVSDGAEKLYEISAKTAAGDMYADENGTLHYIIRESFYNYVQKTFNLKSQHYNYIYFDISHDSIEMPFYGDIDAFEDNVKVYKNCKVVPTNGMTHTNFSKDEAEFVGNFNEDKLNAAWRGEENNEESKIIQEMVFDGLTYVSEAKGIYFGMNYNDFEEFWQDAELRIGLAYGYEKTIDTSGVEYIKEALETEWDEYVSTVNLYAADLNGDGVKELFANYSFGAAMNGFVYVYDVSDGVKKLYEIPARIWYGNSGLYTDSNGVSHFILENIYSSTSSGEEDRAIFDIAYVELKQPFFADVYEWYDGGAHMFEYDLYKNCEIVPDAKVFDGRRNFDSEKAEYIGRYDIGDVNHAFILSEENEVREIINKEVYEGLTYVSDIEELYRDSGYNSDYGIAWEFEYFWQDAAPILAKVYGDTSKEN